jgi:hypothetical protein
MEEGMISHREHRGTEGRRQKKKCRNNGSGKKEYWNDGRIGKPETRASEHQSRSASEERPQRA